MIVTQSSATVYDMVKLKRQDGISIDDATTAVRTFDALPGIFFFGIKSPDNS